MGIEGVHLKEGLRFFKNKLNHKKHHEYHGTPRDICINIVRDNWNGHYFQSGVLNHTNLTIRDIGICAESLVYMGFRHEVTQTLEYALNVFSHYNKITSTITREHKPVNFFAFPIDSLPFLMRTMRLLGTGHLFSEYEDFLNKQIELYYKTVFDEKKEIVYENKTFSSFKSHTERKSSMYDNCCAAMLAREIEIMRKQYNFRLVDPFLKWNYKKIIRDRFWVGTHFLDDISDHHYIAADANIFPFYFGIFEDREMIHSAVNMLISQNLDTPMPMKFQVKRIAEKENAILSMVSNGFHGDICQTKLGVLFLEVLVQHNRILARKYIDMFLESLENHNNFLEAFDSLGKPFVSNFYRYDEGMLWASVFYHTLEEFYKPLKHHKPIIK